MKIKPFYQLLFLSLLLSIVSCKKDSASSDSDSYVKIKMNGTWVTYKALGELGPDLGDATKTDLGVSGYSTDMKNGFDIAIQIDGTNFKTGSYDSYEDTQYTILVSYTYNPDVSTIKDYSIYDAPGREPSKYIINITSITPTELRGTFTGNYLYNDFHDDGDADGGIVQITEGEFKVKRVR